MKTIYTPYAVTVSAASAGPPSSPSTGDIWIASNVDSNGTRWQFQYNAGSSSAYKWEFIGGPPVFVLGSGDNTSVTATSWTYDSTGPTWTPSRGGDYYVQVGMRTDGTEGQQSFYGLAQSGSPTPQVYVNVRDLTDWNDSMHAGIATGLTASSAFRAYIQNTGGAGQPARQFSRWASILPVRVS